MDEQNRYVKEKLIDFVVIRVVNEEDNLQIPYLNENYKIFSSGNIFTNTERSFSEVILT